LSVGSGGVESVGAKLVDVDEIDMVLRLDIELEADGSY